MKFTLPIDRTASGAVAYVDKNGGDAPIDGTPTMSVSDDTLLALEQNGAAFKLKPTGVRGSAQVTIKADADLSGDGVEEVITLIELDLVGGKAVAGNVTLELDPLEPPPQV